VSKPPITIKCECGESNELAYGERWQCESCGRTWDTRQIPAVEYDGLLRRMRRVRLEAFVIAGLVAAVVIPLIVFVNTAIILLVPGVAAIWLFFYLPFWRRRARRAARQSPNWELHPDQSGADAPS
jgi:Flp pilus assembly protein TadB